MGFDLLPQFIRENYEVHEYKHACAILHQDFPEQWNEIMEVLTNFRLKESDIMAPGGRKSPIASAIDDRFYEMGWHEKEFKTKIVIDDVEKDTPTHKVDCVKGRVALDIEWNNKDPFFDRDLNNFRLLFDRDAISVAVIITRCSDLQDVFNRLGKGASYGASTTHMRKLLPRIDGLGAGGCPVLVFGISKSLVIE